MQPISISKATGRRTGQGQGTEWAPPPPWPLPVAGAYPIKVSPAPEYCLSPHCGMSGEAINETFIKAKAELATQNKAGGMKGVTLIPLPQPLHPTPGQEELWGSGIRLALPFHKGLEEASQLLEGWHPHPQQQTPHSLQAFLLQVLLLLPQPLALTLPAKAGMSSRDRFPPD